MEIKKIKIKFQGMDTLIFCQIFPFKKLNLQKLFILDVTRGVPTKII